MKKFLFLAVAAVCMGMCSCTERIDAGHVGVKVNMYGDKKGVDDVVSVSGRVWYNPFTESVYEFPVFVQTKDYEPFVVNAKDASSFTVDPKISYLVNQEKVPAIFKKYRKNLEDIENEYIRTAVYDAYRIVANKFTSDSLMSSREGFEEEVQMELQKSLDSEGFDLQQLTSAITPPESLSEAINAKNKAIQTALQAENKVRQAEAEAKIAVAKEEGIAKALRIKADAEAYYNDQVGKSLSSNLVEMERIKKWNGQFPSTVAGSGSSFMLGVK